MSSASSFPTDGPWVRPWTWAGAGFLLCALAALGLLAGSNNFEPARLALLAVGLLASGIGIAARFRVEPLSRLARAPGIVHLVLALVFMLLAVGLTAMLVASWFGIHLLGLRPGLALIVWLLVGPLSARAGWQSLERLRRGAPLARTGECALMLLLGAGTAGIACFALASLDPDVPSDWFTLQRFLFVLGLAALAAAPLTVVDVPTRRVVASGLILFHLLGLVTAALGQPPAPWLVNQAWTRIYRPYLEFLYLNNAYHFYSPEPGPPSHLWFRLYFTDENHAAQAVWFKVPRLYDNGHHGHATSLIYQRHLSITENVIAVDGYAADNPQFEKIAERRMAWTPEGAKRDDPIVGKDAPKQDLLVPLNPRLTKAQQYRQPQTYVKRFLESYARHVVRKVAAEHSTWKFERMRVYRVIHQIPPHEYYLLGIEATDPEFYWPIYMGEYNAHGKLLNEEDPLLYWMLPILRDPPSRVYSPIRDWARRHAGDPYWIRVVHSSGYADWVDENGKPAPD